MAEGVEGDQELDMGWVRAMCATLPEPPWDDARARRVFDGIMERIDLQRSRRLWLKVGAAIATPFALLAASRLTR